LASHGLHVGPLFGHAAQPAQEASSKACPPLAGSPFPPRRAVSRPILPQRSQRLTAVQSSKFKVQSSRFKVKGSSGSRPPTPDSPACPGAPGFPLPESRLPVPEAGSNGGGEPPEIRDSANAARTPDPARRNRLALSLIYFPACEGFHERKCFCKSGTYVKWDPSKTDAEGSKHYQVLIKSVQEV
jgi:hypothetical protein